MLLKRSMFTIWKHHLYRNIELSIEFGIYCQSRCLTTSTNKKGSKIYRKGRRPSSATKSSSDIKSLKMKDRSFNEIEVGNTIKTLHPTSETTLNIKSTTDSTNNLIRRFQQWRESFMSTTDNTKESMLLTVLRWIVPKRYRFPSNNCRPMYSYQQGILIGQRLLLLWLPMVVVLFLYEDTAPYEIIGIRGPSMIPTMAADGSDLWLCRIYPSYLRQLYSNIIVGSNSWIYQWFLLPKLQRGTIIGFAHPDSPNAAISMKRIVGLPGDRIQRYGQYVHLYIDQDPIHWGITWPSSTTTTTTGTDGNNNNLNHAWILERKTSWDVIADDDNNSNLVKHPMLEAKRTMIVPEGHVWIEADCPALGLDSRQFGPIPISWIRSRVIAKVWPIHFNSKKNSKRWYHRPHPIPLDVETLMEYNVYYKTPSEADVQ